MVAVVVTIGIQSYSFNQLGKHLPTPLFHKEKIHSIKNILVPLSKYIHSVNLLRGDFLCTLFNTASSAAPQIPFWGSEVSWDLKHAVESKKKISYRVPLFKAITPCLRTELFLISDIIDCLNIQWEFVSSTG
jgi:hypothetical protein